MAGQNFMAGFLNNPLSSGGIDDFGRDSKCNGADGSGHERNLAGSISRNLKAPLCNGVGCANTGIWWWELHGDDRWTSGRSFYRATGGEEVNNDGVEIVQPTGSRAFGTFFIDGTHVVDEFGAHEVTATGTSIALSVATDCTSFFRTDSDPVVGTASIRQKKRKSNGIIPPDD